MPEQAREQVFARSADVSASPTAAAASTATNVASFKSRPDQTDFDVIVVGAACEDLLSCLFRHSILPGPISHHPRICFLFLTCAIVRIKHLTMRHVK